MTGLTPRITTYPDAARQIARFLVVLLIVLAVSATLATTASTAPWVGAIAAVVGATLIFLALGRQP